MGAVAAALLCYASPSQAQIRPYLVAEGALERRQVQPDGQAPSALPDNGDVSDREDGFAYGLAAGVEAPLSPTLFAAVEAGVSKSTVDTEATTFRGIEVVESVFVGVLDRTQVRPRWSYAVTGRFGVNLSRSAAVYALAGAGGERVRINTASSVDFGFGSGTVELRTRRSYEGAVFGGGARLFLSDRVGLRVEYSRMETDDGYDPQRLSAGLLYRF